MEMSCTISIMRESRLMFCGRKVQIYVDGVLADEIANGGQATGGVAPGKHEISFAIGKKIMTDLVVEISDELESLGIVCWVDGYDSIEVKMKNFEVPHSVTHRQKPVASTILEVVLGVILVLIAIRFALWIAVLSIFT